MAYGQLLLLGAIAGLTVFLGLPVAALQRVSLRVKGALNGVATGILVFLSIEILSQVLDAGEEHVSQALAGPGLGAAVPVLAMLLAGLTFGLVGIPLLERWLLQQWSQASRPLGFAAQPLSHLMKRTEATRLQPYALALMIAAGIGLHNFSEGLAIGQTASSGAVSLALVLIVGFALHNMTEGFGIAAPLSGESRRPGFGFLAVAGLIAGGPTFLGTLVGASWHSQTASILFLSLAGGALLYVIAELFRLGHAMLSKVPFMLSVALGFAIGYLTEMIIGLSLGI